MTPSWKSLLVVVRSVATAMVFGLVGLLFNLATFPGIIFSGLVQRLFAVLFDAPMAHVAVDESVDDPQELLDRSDEEVREQVVKLDEGEEAPEGMREEFVVNHAGIDSYLGLVLVVLGPFFVSSTLAFVGFLIAVPLEVVNGILYGVAMWLSFSLGAHAFPNSSATDALWRRSKNGDSLLRVVGYPIVGVAVLVNMLEFLWLDAIYAVVLYWVALEGVWGAILGLA